MNNFYKEKTAIVTGAAQGIGFEIAHQLLKQDANVILNDVDSEWLDKAAHRLDTWKERLVVHQGDASRKDNILEMVQLAVEHYQGLDMAIANAGLTIEGEFLDFTEERLHQMLGLNLAGSFFLAQAAAKQMIKQQRGGRILFLSSVTGVQAHKNLEGYGMTKAALKMLAKCLGPGLASHRINVNCIAPGATITERTLQLDPDYANSWGQVIPDGRPAKTLDIAQACLFFLGPQSDHITGQTLVVDGGWTAVSPLPGEQKN